VVRAVLADAVAHRITNPRPTSTWLSGTRYSLIDVIAQIEQQLSHPFRAAPHTDPRVGDVLRFGPTGLQLAMSLSRWRELRQADVGNIAVTAEMTKSSVDGRTKPLRAPHWIQPGR
jgi:hypothetical protein